jgi:hypothetical protein
MLIEVIARHLRHPMARAQNVLHALSAKVDVAIAQPFLLIDLVRFMLIRQDRRRLGLVENLKLLSDDFDLAGGELPVRFAGASSHRALDRDDILSPQGAAGGDDVLIRILKIEDHLRQTIAIAKVDEDQALALIAVGVDPAAKRDGLADVLGPQFTAGVCALQHRENNLPFRVDAWTAAGKAGGRVRIEHRTAIREARLGRGEPVLSTARDQAGEFDPESTVGG